MSKKHKLTHLNGSGNRVLDGTVLNKEVKSTVAEKETVQEEPMINIDGVPVITIANFQKLIYSLVAKLIVGDK